MTLKKAVIIGTVAVGAVVVAPVVIGALGFGSSGVVGGSCAAAIQSGIGNVAAGSTFASLQSSGVVGLATTTKLAIGATAAGIGAFAFGGSEVGESRASSIQSGIGNVVAGSILQSAGVLALAGTTKLAIGAATIGGGLTSLVSKL